MAKKKEEEAPAGSPAWMATFSDLMNLLLCFFVLLFSMSSVDAAKYDQVVQSLSAAFSIINTSGGVSITEGQLISSGLSQLPEFSNFFGDTMSDGKNTKEGEGETGTGTTGEDESQEHGSTEFPEYGQVSQGEADEGTLTEQGSTGTSATPVDETSTESNPASSDAEISTEEAIESYEQQELSASEQMAQQIEALAVQYGIQDLVQVDFNGQYVRITLNGALLFDSGSAELSPDALPLVEKIAKIIDYYDDSLIEIEGHTDNVPIRSSRYESNDVLSMYRALYVADYIRGISSVNPANVLSSGRGAYVPIADNGTAEGRARNRRVEVKIYNSFNSQDIENPGERSNAVAPSAVENELATVNEPAASETQTAPASSESETSPTSEPVSSEERTSSSSEPVSSEERTSSTSEPATDMTESTGNTTSAEERTDAASTEGTTLPVEDMEVNIQ